MQNIGWDEAIHLVLNELDGPTHYKAIAEEIATKGYRKSLGATPANTLNAYINTSIHNYRSESPYLKIGRGYYALRKTADEPRSNSPSGKASDEQPNGLIQSLGMYWRSSDVVWKNRPRILGQQQSGSDLIDFCEQIGVYLLHDRSRVIYVGRSVDRPLGQRLYEHTKDRLSGRWDRFSWFGLKAVSEDGTLEHCDLAVNDTEVVISSLEAVLIEALEPPQNRRRGDQLSAVEYLQATDSEKDQQRADAIASLISGSLMSS